jgi:N-acetylneuraminic acid mutarotase/glucose/arabinose dehydrogenase
MRSTQQSRHDATTPWGRWLALVTMAVLFLAAAQGSSAAENYELKLSLSPDRSGATILGGQQVNGNVYVFTTPDTGVSKVRFYLDDPTMAGTPRLIEKGAPYDFAGTNADMTAKPFDTKKIADGSHTITAAVDRKTGGTQVLSGTFTVKQLPKLTATPASFSFLTKEAGTSVTGTTDIIAGDGSAASINASSDVAWATVSSDSGTTPATLTVTASPLGLSPGTYSGTVTVAAVGYVTTAVSISMKVAPESWCSVISPLECAQVLVQAPYRLDFGSPTTGVADANGVETGFRMIDPSTNGDGYLPSKLTVDFNTPGTLKITTTSGLASGTTNSQDNALGIGIDAPDQVSLLTTTMLNIPAGTGKNEQAGLWFGVDEDNHVKLAVRSGSTGTTVQFLLEVGGVQKNSLATDPLTIGTQPLVLNLRGDPVTRGVTANYAVGDAPLARIGRFTVPGEFFSSDAAGIDPTIGTRTFGGIFASHRSATTPVTYMFDEFRLEAETSSGTGGASSAFAFDRTSFALPRPSSMAFGPDGRLYVTEFLGTIHAITLDSAHQPIADEVITTLGSRLTLGLAIDPASTPGNVILWVSHSDRNLTNDAPANSSVVSRLSGPGFTVRQDVITGLPRSTANHSVNSLHFGPDSRLYLAISGNTGAGAPNSADSEFRDRPEQPLSAAILVADVKAPGFEGSCATPVGEFDIPATCDVTTHATGMRNSYDFTFHSNGSMYATDNGLGVTGSFPPSPTPPCTGLASTEPWDAGGHNPGEQDDFLYRVQSGKYYGHPNPYREECVFKAGQYQSAAPLPNYEPPLISLGRKKSSNGIIEYKGSAFAGALQGTLLVANYSQGDDIVRVRLSPDGLTALGIDSVAGGFSDPLPIVEGPDGTIYVGEFGSSQITALVPRTSGSWTTRQPLPLQLLDAGGTALNGKLYVVGGKTASGPRRTLYVFDPAANTWTEGPSLPAAYPAVENPAVAAYDGKLYVFGGSTDAFAGAVTNAAVFDPATSSWSMLAPLATGRGGASAQAVGDRLYVVGGMDGTGSSLSSVEAYDPATNTWSAAASMSTRRDNAGTAVLGGKLYAFGGRIRNADGTTLNATLSSVERFDPATGAWTSQAPMPTGRRTMAVGVLNGRAQVMGGERTTDGGTFPQNEEYDPVTDTWRPLTSMPTPRHGAVAGTIAGVVYVAGGGPVAGSSYSDVTEAFTFAG